MDYGRIDGSRADLLKEGIEGRDFLLGVNPLGIVATETAYSKGGMWLDEVKSYIDSNLAYLGDFLRERLPEARFRIPEGTYFAWIDLRRYGFSAPELEERMKHEGPLLDEGAQRNLITGRPGDDVRAVL